VLGRLEALYLIPETEEKERMKRQHSDQYSTFAN
jgi:hypothetical protein